MKTLKHTQGNWDYSTSLGEISITGTSCDIALVNTGTSINYQEGVANAKLITSAPELLENLIRCVDRLEENGFGDMSAVARAKKAIKNATE
jgi:hypothetical protein